MDTNIEVTMTYEVYENLFDPVSGKSIEQTDINPIIRLLRMRAQGYIVDKNKTRLLRLQLVDDSKVFLFPLSS